jgi:hypothetical protein
MKIYREVVEQTSSLVLKSDLREVKEKVAAGKMVPVEMAQHLHSSCKLRWVKVYPYGKIQKKIKIKTSQIIMVQSDLGRATLVPLPLRRGGGPGPVAPGHPARVGNPCAGAPPRPISFTGGGIATGHHPTSQAGESYHLKHSISR